MAQAPDQIERQKKEDAQTSATALPNMQLGALPATRLDSNGTVGEFLLEGSADDKFGTAAVGWKNGNAQFRLAAKGPLSRKGGQATPLSLDGLASDGSLEFSFNDLRWHASSPDDIDELQGMCTTILREECRLNPASCSVDPKTPPLPEDLLDPCGKRALPLPVCQKSLCDYGSMPRQYQGRAAELLHLNERIWFWGGAIAASRPTFEYLDRADLSAKSVNRNAWSASARIGIFSPSLGFLIASYTFQKSYRPGSEPSQICQPIPARQATTCSEAVIGAPTEAEASVVSLEIRKFFAKGTAVAPIVQRDLKKKVTLVALPVYFIKSSSGGPTGGVRLAWKSDTNAATVSLFVGAALSLQ